MPTTIDSPVALAARLAAKRRRTILIIEGDLIHERQLGFGWNDALEALWSGEFDGLVRLVDFDDKRLTAEDVTVAAAMELGQRTFSEGRTPDHLESLLGFHGVPFFRAGRMRRDPWAEHRLGKAHLGLVR